MIVYKVFSTPKGNYVYDRNTNTVIKVSEDEYSILEKNENIENNNENNEFNQVVQKFQKQGYLSQNKLEKIEHPDTKYFKYYLDNCIEQLILQVTQNCNLRCSYCVYSGGYFQRNHSNKRMSFELAKQVIDFYIDHTKEMKELTVAFYGGEPLLEFDLIKKCIDYIERRVPTKKIIYSMTTNGTILNREIVEYLSHKKFNMMLSLDGGKKEHDESRKFVSGKGSFDIILKNIEDIYQYYPEFIQNITINTVLNPKNDINRICKYFDEHPIFSKMKIRKNLIEVFQANQKVYYASDYFLAREYELLELYLMLTNKIKYHEPSFDMISKRLDIDKLYKSLRNTNFRLNKVYHHNGPCIAGVQRLFVTVDGQFYPCERVSETSSSMNIGNIKEGFDVKRVDALTNIGRLSESQCKKCWALPQCSMCAAYAEENGKLCKSKKLSYCNRSRQLVMNSLIEVSMLKEMGYKFGGDNI